MYLNPFTPGVKPWVLTFESVDETLVCDHWNESCWAVLSCGIVCFWQFCKMEFTEIFSWLSQHLLSHVETMPCQTVSTFREQKNIEKMSRQRGCQTPSTSALNKCWNKMLRPFNRGFTGEHKWTLANFSTSIFVDTNNTVILAFVCLCAKLMNEDDLHGYNFLEIGQF